MRKSIMGTLALLALLASVKAGLAAISAVNVTGKLTAGGAAGSNVSASCRVTKSGLAGSGTLSGRNPQTGANYSYPFNITGGRTTPNTLILTGRLVNGPDITLTAQSPSGALTVVYKLANGGSSTSSGQGTVTTR